MGTFTPASAGLWTETDAKPTRASTSEAAIGLSKGRFITQASGSLKRARDRDYTTKPKGTPTNTPRQSELGGEEPTSTDQEIKKASRNLM